MVEWMEMIDGDPEDLDMINLPSHYCQEVIDNERLSTTIRSPTNTPRDAPQENDANAALSKNAHLRLALSARSTLTQCRKQGESIEKCHPPVPNVESYFVSSYAAHIQSAPRNRDA
jgi:hypothetical protein